MERIAAASPALLVVFKSGRLVHRGSVFHESSRACRLPSGSPDRRGLLLQSGHLSQAPAVSLGAAEGRRNESLSVIPGDLDTHDPSAQAEDIHLIVFDPLANRIVVVAQTGPNPSYLIGRHGSPDAAARLR